MSMSGCMRASQRSALNPGVGHVRDDLGDESLRVWPVFSYLIMYLPDTNPVQVIRVIHGARNVRKVLEQEQ